MPRKEEGRTRKDEEDRLRRVEEQGAASKAQDDTHQQQPNHFESIPLEACATDETAAATHTHTLPQAAGAEVQVPQINLPHASLPQILLNSHTLTGGKGQVGKGGQGGGSRVAGEGGRLEFRSFFHDACYKACNTHKREYSAQRRARRFLPFPEDHQALRLP